MIKDHTLQHPSFEDRNFRCVQCGQEWPISDGVLEQIKQDNCIRDISTGSKSTPTFVTVTGQIIKGKS